MKLIIALDKPRGMEKAKELGWLPGISFLVVTPKNYESQLRGLSLSPDDVTWVDAVQFPPQVELAILEQLDIIFWAGEKRASRDENS